MSINETHLPNCQVIFQVIPPGGHCCAYHSTTWQLSDGSCVWTHVCVRARMYVCVDAGSFVHWLRVLQARGGIPNTLGWESRDGSSWQTSASAGSSTGMTEMNQSQESFIYGTYTQFVNCAYTQFKAKLVQCCNLGSVQTKYLHIVQFRDVTVYRYDSVLWYSNIK